MQLYCISFGVPSVDEHSLTAALRSAGSAFPGFTEGPSWSAASTSGAVLVAGLHHPDDLIGPRSYVARADHVLVAFDGMPVHRRGGWSGHDAEALLTHWSEIPEVAEGQFSALRVDLARDDVAFVTDAMGVAPLYYVLHEGGHLVANSVEVLRLLTGISTPSPLGVSSLLTMGWAAGDATLLAGIRALAAGSEYRLSRAGLVKRPYLSPAIVAAQARSGRRITTDEIVADLTDLVSAAVSSDIAVRCPMTAGRDSRLILCLLLASDARNLHCYTGGRAGDIDVDGAHEVTRALGLDHETRPLEVLDTVDWVDLVKMFVSQTDGLSSLIQVGDYNNQLDPPSAVGIKTPGLGGELGRCGVRVIPYATNFPPFFLSTRVQQELVMERAAMYKDLWTAQAVDEVSQYVGAFMRERRSEGWKKRELNEAHYAFDRVTRWGSTSVRRTASTDDVFTPYCSRAFLTYCFSLSPEERYIEASHYRILSALSPRMRDLPFAKPWSRQDPRLVPLLASADLGKHVLKRFERWGPSSRPRPSAPAQPRYWMRWFEAHHQDHMDLCLSLPDSPLWAWINRATVEQAFRAEPSARAHLAEGLARVTTLFWYFHGRHMR